MMTDEQKRREQAAYARDLDEYLRWAAGEMDEPGDMEDVE